MMTLSLTPQLRLAAAPGRLLPRLCGVLLACLTVGCAQLQPLGRSEPMGVIDITERPAERALLSGMRAYDDGQYPEAARLLNLSISSGLASKRDKAAAYKYLAFIYCTSKREAACESAFKAARQADPKFSLSKSEAGHPMWGPIYRKVVPQ